MNIDDRRLCCENWKCPRVWLTREWKRKKKKRKGMERAEVSFYLPSVQVKRKMCSSNPKRKGKSIKYATAPTTSAVHKEKKERKICLVSFLWWFCVLGANGRDREGRFFLLFSIFLFFFNNKQDIIIYF